MRALDPMHAGRMRGLTEAGEHVCAPCRDALRSFVSEQTEREDFAATYFELHYARVWLRLALELLLSSCGSYRWYTSDGYDRSVEVCCADAEDAAEFDSAPLYRAGFAIVWVHDHANGRGEPSCQCPARPRPAT